MFPTIRLVRSLLILSALAVVLIASVVLMRAAYQVGGTALAVVPFVVAVAGVVIVGEQDDPI